MFTYLFFSPISFHPLSVIFETPNHAALLEKVGVKAMVSEIFDELVSVAQAQDCKFPPNFKQKTIDEMARGGDTTSIMYQDFSAKRPMEVETYLGSPIKLAQTVGMKVPRIETLYAILHNLNIVNQQRKDIVGTPINGTAPPVRLSSAPQQRPMMNGPMNGVNGGGRGRGGRTSSMNGPPPGMRRGPPPMNGGPPNGYPRPMNGANGYASRNQSRRGSLEGNDLGEEFSHLVLYDDIPESGESNYGGDGSNMALRERELMLRQRELALREQEMRLRRGPPPPPVRRGPPPSVRNDGFDDDDDDDYYVDPQDIPPMPQIDPDNFDMMSVTSRRNRKAPSASQLRKNPEFGEPNGRRGGGFVGRPGASRNRSSARLISQVPGLHDSIMDDPLMGYSSNRYGNVDRQAMGMESRTNSLTAARLDELQYTGPPNGNPNGPPGPYPRRASQSPGNPYSPQIGRGGRPSPPNGYGGPMNGRPSPPGGPGGMRQPVPRHPPGQGNSVAPQQVENYAGVSALHPPKGPVNVRSLTGSASASAGSGESAHLDSEPSAHSSQSSLGPRPPMGVR